MRIINLTEPKSMIYSSNAYLVLGDHSAIEDVNTLIDVGNDPSVMDKIMHSPTGVGKRAVEQVILTHTHFDHTGILPLIRSSFNPTVYAFSPYMVPDVILRDGEMIRCGDRMFQVLYTPGHSDDSVCLFCPTDGALFVGDTPVVIRAKDQTYDDRFIRALEQLCSKDVKTIYFGHGEPIRHDAQAVLLTSLHNVKEAQTLRGK